MHNSRALGQAQIRDWLHWCRWCRPPTRRTCSSGAARWQAATTTSAPACPHRPPARWRGWITPPPPPPRRTEARAQARAPPPPPRCSTCSCLSSLTRERLHTCNNGDQKNSREHGPADPWKLVRSSENKSVSLYEIVRTSVCICRTKNQLWTRPCFGAGDACPCARIGAHRGRRRRGLCTGRTYQGPARASVAVVAWRAHGRLPARLGGGDAWAATSARGRGRRCRLARPQSCTRHGALDQQCGGAQGQMRLRELMERGYLLNNRRGKKNIVLSGTYVSDLLNRRKLTEWRRNGTRV